MPKLTYVAMESVFNPGEPGEWKAHCDEHQWAVKDGNIDAVEALIREHVREHPTVHCLPPPEDIPQWQYPNARFLRYKVQQFVYRDGTVTHCGQCGECRWHMMHVLEPVDAYMEAHWVAAHQGDHTEEKRNG